MALVERFPLELITNAETNNRALVIVIELTHREDDLTDGELAYFKALVDLVYVFEKKTYLLDVISTEPTQDRQK